MSTVKNADRYSRLVDVCTGYGGRFNPGHLTLQLKAMRALLKEAQSSLQDVSQKRVALTGITNERAKAYHELERLVGQILGTMKASRVPADKLASARYYTRLIIGVLKSRTDRQPVPSEDNEEQPAVTRGIKQQSYVAKAHNFMQLAHMINQEVPSYMTTLAHLQPAALLEKAEALKALNESWSQAKVALTNARVHRDTLFYRGPESVLSIANAVKSYIRVEFGSRSEEVAQLSELSFTKQKVR
ncbi:MAG: hypothetical protein KDC99_17375 [Cyclobacteriaceae bacterium]|nr:hypothetical protein [Cyclobacteriaceae bacterium]